VANLVVAPVDANGRVWLYNGSAGTVQLFADASGYFLSGAPAAAGAFGAIPPVRLLDTTHGVGAPQAAVGPGKSIAVQMTGRGQVPASGVSSVVINVMVYQPTAAGYLTAWGGGNRPGVSSLSFVRGQQVPNLVVAPVDANGRVWFYNGSAGTVQLFADASGYLLSSDLPEFSSSHYVRNITGNSASDTSAMNTDGCSDAQNGSTLVLLDIGAQSNTNSPASSNGTVLSPANPGVRLTVLDPPVRLTYAQLVTAVNAYTAGFASCTSSAATIAVSTNNDGDFTAYSAAAKAADWANLVIDALTPHANLTLVGAIDIEAGFASTEADAQTWETDYLAAATTKQLIFNGSADACPTTVGAVNQSCQPVKDDNGVVKTWTQAQYYALAGGTDPSQIRALPQIYVTDQATQWANIDATGGKGIVFAGALTEYAACPTASAPGCGVASLQPVQGWAALRNALSNIGVQPAKAVTDLKVN
jgi:hypothetical protein